MGWWVGQQIESGVVHQTAANAALYVTSIVEPHLQELAVGDTISPDHQATLERLLHDTSFGKNITGLKVWNPQGKVIYATDPANTGMVFPIDDDLAQALRGWVASEVSTLNKPENVHDRDWGVRRLETYNPVRRTGTSDVIAVVEFYQSVDDLDRNIATAQRQSWLIVAVVTIGMYVVLAGFVRRGEDTIRRQQHELSIQVQQLSALLSQNDELHERVRRAAQRTTTLNERFLRRISAELHDGPAQDLGLALLRLDHVGRSDGNGHEIADGSEHHDFQIVQSSLHHALQEIRAISAGMGLPELEHLTLGDTVVRVVRAHERRTRTKVALAMEDVPDDVSVSVKITVYRIIQEALSNAYRHADARDQQVELCASGRHLHVAIADRGPGFEYSHGAEWDEHLGLAGMRERVESLGGRFQIVSAPGQGTRIMAQLALDAT